MSAKIKPITAIGSTSRSKNSLSDNGNPYQSFRNSIMNLQTQISKIPRYTTLATDIMNLFDSGNSNTILNFANTASSALGINSLSDFSTLTIANIEEIAQKLQKAFDVAMENQYKTYKFDDMTLNIENTITITTGTVEVKGFLNEEGFQLSLNNQYSSLFGDSNQFAAIGKALTQAESIGITSRAELLKKLENAGKIALSGGDVNTLISGVAALGGQNKGVEKGLFIMNSPIYYTGTDYLNFSLNFKTLATSHGEINEQYKQMMKAFSPNINAGEGNGAFNSFLYGKDFTEPEQPVIMLYNAFTLSKIVVDRLTVTIKGPFDYAGSPVIGEYQMSGKTSQILNKALLDSIWGTVRKVNPKLISLNFVI